MDNIVGKCTVIEIMKITVKEDFHRGRVFFLLPQITLFEKKYDIKFFTSISMYDLKPLVSLDRFIKN